MRFAMADKGSVFSTRDRADLILAELEQAQAADDGDHELILDFTSVTNVSDSFADGFVGRITSQRRSCGLPDPLLVGRTPFVQLVIDRSLRLRGLAPALALAA
jgi:anti-anti-sigma regulatory factor